MSKKILPNNTTNFFYIKEREDIPIPFELGIRGSQYTCIKILRHLPFKRLVVEATNDNTHAVIKLYPQTKKGKKG